MTVAEFLQRLEQVGCEAYGQEMRRFCEQWPELAEEVAQLARLAVLGKHWYSAVLLLGLCVWLAGPVRYRIAVEGQEIVLYDWQGFCQAVRSVRLLARMERKGIVTEVCGVLEVWAKGWGERQEEMILGL